jgi:hypothetical protein
MRRTNTDIPSISPPPLLKNLSRSPLVPRISQEEDLETPRPRESFMKVPRPSVPSRPKPSKVPPPQIVVQSVDIPSLLSSLESRKPSQKSKRSEIDERRVILLKAQISSLNSKNAALLEVNKRQRK